MYIRMYIRNVVETREVDMAVRSSKVRKQEGEEMGWCKETQQFVPVSVLRPTTRIESLYVRMPMTWLRDIRELPSAAMLVSGVLWHLAGVRRLATVSLGNSLLRGHGFCQESSE